MNSFLLRSILRSKHFILQNDSKAIPQFYARNLEIQMRFCSSETENPKGSKLKSRKHDPERDRRVPVDVESSIKYLQSNEFTETYKNYKIWELFRRNFPGQLSPSKPRIQCVEDGWVKTSNPCVICRDRYLVLHYTNIDLLQQFISPHTGYIYPNTIICLCSEQYEKLCVAMTLAKNYGLIDFVFPSRQYNYSHYYKTLPENFVE